MKAVEVHPFKFSGSAKKAIILFANAEMGFLGSVLSGKKSQEMAVSFWKYLLEDSALKLGSFVPFGYLQGTSGACILNVLSIEVYNCSLWVGLGRL